MKQKYRTKIPVEFDGDSWSIDEASLNKAIQQDTKEKAKEKRKKSGVDGVRLIVGLILFCLLGFFSIRIPGMALVMMFLVLFGAGNFLKWIEGP